MDHRKLQSAVKFLADRGIEVTPREMAEWLEDMQDSLRARCPEFDQGVFLGEILRGSRAARGEMYFRFGRPRKFYGTSGNN